MNLYKSIAFFVCPNGLGHLRRAISIIEKLLQIKYIKIRLFISKNKSNSLLIKYFKKLPRTELIFFDLPHPAYDENDYDYLLILDDLKPHLKKIDAIISDNLIYPFLCSEVKHKFCIAQFFWHNLISHENLSFEKRKIINLEMDYLGRNKFITYGSSIFSMRDVSQYKLFKAVDLVDNPLLKKTTSVKEKKGILITDGTTSSSREYLARIIPGIVQISKNYGLEVYISPRISKKENFKQVKIFKYNSTDFSNLILGICRPGLGIISDLLYSGAIPIPCFLEKNYEMQYNQSTLNNLFEFEDNQTIEYYVESSIKNLSRLQNKISEFNFSGAYQIRDSLIKQLNFIQD